MLVHQLIARRSTDSPEMGKRENGEQYRSLATEGSQQARGCLIFNQS
jgi:hypothetical protein